LAGSSTGALKARETVLKKYGADYYARIGRKGGANGHTGGFYGNPEKARECGRLGGKMSKRGQAKAKAQK